MKLIETRISDVQPGDQWFFEGAWVAVTEVEVKHPDDRVAITYYQDDDPTELDTTSVYRGFEVAIVKRP